MHRSACESNRVWNPSESHQNLAELHHCIITQDMVSSLLKNLVGLSKSMPYHFKDDFILNINIDILLN